MSKLSSFIWIYFKINTVDMLKADYKICKAFLNDEMKQLIFFFVVVHIHPVHPLTLSITASVCSKMCSWVVIVGLCFGNK